MEGGREHMYSALMAECKGRVNEPPQHSLPLSRYCLKRKSEKPCKNEIKLLLAEGVFFLHTNTQTFYRELEKPVCFINSLISYCCL